MTIFIFCIKTKHICNFVTTVAQESANHVGHVQVWYTNRQAFCVKSEAIVVVSFRSF
jgi:hypothetical protein